MSRIQFALLLSAATLPWVAAAQQPTSYGFAEAASRVLAAHPEFRRLSLELEATRAQARAAELKPPLELGAEVEDFGGPDQLNGLTAAEATVSISSVLERGGKRSARIDVASRAVDVLSIEQRIEMLDLIAETGRRFVAVGAAEEMLARAQERAEQARRTLELIRTRVEAARSPPTERLNAEIERGAADLAVGDAQRSLATTRFALASLWAAPTEVPVADMDFYALPEPRAFAELALELESLPDIERYAAEARLREAELRLAKTQGTPDWRWSAGLRRHEALDEQAFVVGFSVPLGSGRRSIATVEEAELRRTAQPLAAEARRLELLPVLHAQWQVLQGARAAVEVITDEQLPRAREVLELTRNGYDIGRFPYRELALVQQQVLDLEQLRSDAAATYHFTRIEIERLTGAQLNLLRGEAR